MLLTEKDDVEEGSPLDDIVAAKKKIAGSFLLIAEDLNYNQQVIIEIAK